MGTISDKLTYLATTKSKIKDVINMTGVGITNDTFRSYAQSLYDGYIATLQDKGTLLDNMNKGTSTGSISGSANLPVYEYKASKLSTQDETPTPSNPIEVKTVKGYSNLFDEEYYNNASLYSSPSTLFRYFAYVKMPDSFKTKFYGNMTLKGTSQNLVFGFSTSDNGVTSRMLNNGTLTSNVEYDFTNATNVYLIIGNSNDIDIARDIPLIFNNYNIIISKTSDKPYVPYGTNYIYNTICGKNLFDKNNVINAFLNSDGTTTTNSTFRVCDYINVSNYEYITISGNSGSSELVCFYDKNKNHINANVGMGSSTNKTITIPNEAIYMRATIKATVLDEYQIEVGQSTTTYEAYKENIITIPLNDNEVCGIGDYKDELVIDEYGHAKLNKKIGKVVLDENNIGFYKGSNYSQIYSIELDVDKFGDQTTAYSNRFIYAYNNNYGSFYINTTKRINFLIDSTITTLAQAQAWLSTHDVYAYYILATEQEIDLGTVDMELYEGTNNITNSENMDMSIRFIKSDFE